jgi:hypothetical protein
MRKSRRFQGHAKLCIFQSSRWRVPRRATGETGTVVVTHMGGLARALCYRAGMSTAKRAVAARMAERRAARADRWRGRHHPEGPESEPPVIRPATAELRQIVRWVRRHYWAVQAVLVVMALTLTALGLTGLLGFWSP